MQHALPDHLTGTVLEGLRAGERLEHLARGCGPADLDLLEANTSDPDPITAVAAVRALGVQGSVRAAEHLVTLLDDDRPDEQGRQLEPEDRHDGDGRVAQAVARERAGRAEPLRPGRPQVVLAQHVERVPW